VKRIVGRHGESQGFGRQTALGEWLLGIGLPTSNSAVAFAAMQVYVSIGYYILAARAALAVVPRELERIATLLGSPPNAGLSPRPSVGHP
jgi:ABC-type sulfate transport system permease component